MAQISVIIPVYNSEKYLEKCLDSIFNQTFQDVEIIAVNDGSKDSSQEILDRYAEKYPEKIKCIYQENAGQSAARNNGLNYATGEYIFFIDSDDYIELDACEKAYNYAKENGLDIVCFDSYTVENETREYIKYRIVDIEKVDLRYILSEASPWNKLIKSEILLKNNLRFTEKRIYEDFELIPQLALYTDKIGYLEEPLYNYVIHSGSTMRQNEYNPKLADIYLVVETLKDKFWDTQYRTELEFLYIEHLLRSAALRFLEYDEGKADIRKISGIMKKNFPKWYKNKYFKQQGYKYKIVCFLVYMKMVSLLKLLVG